MGNRACKFNDGTYQVLHIAEPQDFSIIEKNIKKTVFEYKNGVMSSNHLSAEKFADGTIDIYLPNNGDYEYIGVIGETNTYTVDPINEGPKG